MPLKVVVVMPAYNAAQTLERTVLDIPDGVVHEVILVDDASSDATVKIAKNLGLKIFVHKQNYGYGGNQKTCYREALRSAADIIVMVHPDYQYDPKCLPSLIAPIDTDCADVVLGSRLLGANPIKQGMPWWKFLANRVLTYCENRIFKLQLSEYHTGYRAYSRRALESVNLEMNSDDFIFDQEIIAQFVQTQLRIAEVPVPTRYFPEASSISFRRSCIYGFRILWLLSRFQLHKMGVQRQPQFDSLKQRYDLVKSAAEGGTR